MGKDSTGEQKIVLSAKLQEEMIRFFLRTSVPKMICEKKDKGKHAPSEKTN